MITIVGTNEARYLGTGHRPGGFWYPASPPKRVDFRQPGVLIPIGTMHKLESRFLANSIQLFSFHYPLEQVPEKESKNNLKKNSLRLIRAPRDKVEYQTSPQRISIILD